MATQLRQSYTGKHRKSSTTSSAKSRVALLALTSSAVAGAGITGTAAAVGSWGTPAGSELSSLASPDIDLAAQAEDSSNSPQLLAASLSDQPGEAEASEHSGLAAAETAGSTPQVLSIPEFKPVAGLGEQLVKAVDAATQRAAADAAMRLPMIVRPAEGALSSGFGIRWGVLHAGIDIAAPLGTPILAAMDGTVIDAGPAQGFGNWVRILHDDGTMTVYGHMSTVAVTVGQRVTAGEYIAGMGSEGFSTGSHLHFEVHPNGVDSGAIDPIPWLAERGITIA